MRSCSPWKWLQISEGWPYLPFLISSTFLALALTIHSSDNACGCLHPNCLRLFLSPVASNFSSVRAFNDKQDLNASSLCVLASGRRRFGYGKQLKTVRNWLVLLPLFFHLLLSVCNIALSQ